MYQSQPDIAIFLRNLTEGGAERVMLNLASGFEKKGVNVEIILANAEGKFLDQVPKEIKVINFNNPNLYNLYGSNLYGKLKLPTGFQSLRSLPKLVNYLRQKNQKPYFLLPIFLTKWPYYPRKLREYLLVFLSQNIPIFL
ncbi:MAG: hypothetical protein MGG11_04885 [Trichodesmium sp. MAG_R03]|nr:hypothetical protein [Trichodesmium sp. MAG_R03]